MRTWQSPKAFGNCWFPNKGTKSNKGKKMVYEIMNQEMSQCC